jgi:hypothetical protein
MQALAVAAHIARTTVIESPIHRVVHPRRSLALSALELRLLEASSFQCSHRVTPTVRLFLERTISPLSGLKRPPLRGDAIFIPALHPRRASPASPVGRGRGPAAAAVAFASLPCVPVPLALLAPPPLRSLTLVAAGIPPRVAGRSPPRLTLAYASGIPPALQKLFIVSLSCVLLLFLVRYSLSHCALRQLASLPHSLTLSHLNRSDALSAAR